MLCREIIAVCSQIHTKHINTAVGAEHSIVNVKLEVHSNHLPLNGYYRIFRLITRTQKCLDIPFDV
jgi:hypothetical protein